MHPIPRFLPILLLSALAAVAQNPAVRGIADREIARKEQLAEFAGQMVAKGRQAMESNDYESAFSYYKSACDALPQAGDATTALRSEAINGFSDAAVQLTEQRISEGRLEDAKATINVVLEERYAPNCPPAVTLRDQLNEPGHYNGAYTPQFIANIEEVKKLLREADGFYQSGRYDLAFKRYEQVLNIDRYNIAARRGMERVNKERDDYAITAYNETRGNMLGEVAAAWELPVKRFDTGPATIIEQPVIDVRGTASISNKLDTINIPRVDFRDATIREAIEFLSQRATQLDNTSSNPADRGLNVVLKLPPGSAEESVQINLSLTDVPLRAALEYVAQAANMKLKIEPYAVVIVPESEPTEVLITKEYKVKPGFISNQPGVSSGGGSIAPLGGSVNSVAAGSGSSIAERSGAKEYLESQGVTFPPGASAIYLPSASKLIVKNTQGNLDIIDALVEVDQGTTPSQVEIESKFLEVTQTNLEELGFDWLVGSFGLPFGTGTYGSGGTNFGGAEINSNSYPFQTPNTGSGTDIPSTPIGANSLTSGLATGGLRSGSRAISVNAVDALLFATPTGPAPGILSVAGVFTNPQFQVVLRALSQKKGVDLVSAPKVTTKSGQRATIEIVREFRYPAEYDLPQLTASFGSNFQPVVPTTPTSFETKNVGITLEVEPTVGPDNFSIDLILAPRVVEFEGFINYGNPIQVAVAPLVFDATVLGTFLGQETIFTATDNVINRPVFSTREVTTEVTVYDGQTVVLGGLLREDVQKVQDKIPILGDIPLAGRLFRSNADQHIKRNLIMFVTASLMDPAGQPLIQVIQEGQDIAAPSAQGVEDEAILGDPLSIPLPQ